MFYFKGTHSTKSLNNEFQTSSLVSDTRIYEQEALQHSVATTFENDVILQIRHGEAA